MSMSFTHNGFTWVNHEGNRVAHTIASMASLTLLLGNWCAHPPSSLHEALVRDKHLLV